jgi:RNA polymerase sigma-32 factor
MTTQLQLRQTGMAVTTGSLEGYAQSAGRFPVLSREDERELAIDLRDNGNLESARRLVLHNLHFVIKIARGYMGYGLPLTDLVQEGNIGLMKAVKRFDPEVKVRLVSFAVHWIRAEIHEYILRNWRIVKVATTKAQRKLFFNLRSSKKRLGWLNQAEVSSVAKDLGVKPEEVMEMESRLTGADLGYDSPAGSNDEDIFTAPAAYLTYDGKDPAESLESADWSAHHKQKLSDAMLGLDDRSRDILQRRWLNESKETLHTLADEYSISAERIRQLEKNAMKKMQAAMAA